MLPSSSGGGQNVRHFTSTPYFKLSNQCAEERKKKVSRLLDIYIYIYIYIHTHMCVYIIRVCMYNIYIHTPIIYTHICTYIHIVQTIWCSIPGKNKIFFFAPVCPDRLWAPASLICCGYRGCLLKRTAASHTHARTHTHTRYTGRSIDLSFIL